MQKSLFVDIDGTLAEWKSASTYEDLLTEGYFRNLRPHEEVVEAINLLNESGLNVYILSAYLSDSQYAVSDKKDWIRQYLPGVSEGHILLCPTGSTKSEVAAEALGVGKISEDAVLLDDYSENLHEWACAGGFAIKLLNGINARKGTWKGATVSRYEEPNEIAMKIIETAKLLKED